MSHYTGLSFIICYRDGENIEPTLTSIKQSYSLIDNPNSNYEILTVRGNHPSMQRNVAVDEASYSHIYFLDNDSILNSEGLDYVISTLNACKGKKEILIMGGPSLIHPQADYFEMCVDGILSSYLVVGRRAARYSQLGEIRVSDGRELILCNMVVNKEFFIYSKRFDYRLYPNEENELLKRVLQYKSRGDILYAPSMFIYRHQRKSYRAFIKQMINYGRGRAEEIKIELSKAKLRGLRLLLLIVLISLSVVSLSGILYIVFSFYNNSYNSIPEIVNSSSDTAILMFYSLYSIGKWSVHLLIWYFIYLFWVMCRASVKKKKILLHFPTLLILGHHFYGLSMFYHLYKKYFISKKKILWFRVIHPFQNNLKTF